MNRPSVALVLAALAPIAFVALVTGRARGEEPPREKVAEPKEAVASLMKTLHANNGAVRIGMTTATADRATPGAAKHVGQRVLPLNGSWLDKERRMNGTVDWEEDLDAGKKVGSIRAVLITERFDKNEMGKAVVAAGKEMGLALEPDEEDPYTWFDANAEGVELWVTIGEGIVVLEAEVLVD